MTVRNLSYMMQPSSVALIAHPQWLASMVRIVARNLLDGGFKGEIFLIGGVERDAEGILNFPTVEDLPKTPDLAVIMAGNDALPDLVGKLGLLGTRAVVIVSPGLEKGTADQTPNLRTAILEAARPHIVRIVGPGSLGIMAPGVNLNASLAHIQPLKGNLAFITQSGAVLTSVLDWATSREIGFSHLIALGNMIDVDFGDLLDYLANDLSTQAILLHMEATTHARKFMSAARLAARMKPVIVLKSGRHAEAESRPGAYPLCGPGPDTLHDAVYDAAFRRAGMLRVHELQELFDAAETLAKARTLAGDRLAILTNGRGIGVLAKDALVEEGGRLAELSSDSHARLNALLPGAGFHGNPIDIAGDATGSRYVQAIEVLLDDKGVDAVLVVNCPNSLASGSEAAQTIVEAIRKGSLKPKANRILTSWLGDGATVGARRLFVENRVPTYDTPHDAIRGFLQVVRYRRNQEMLMQTPPSIPEVFSPDIARVQQTIDRALAAGRASLDEVEVKDVLTAYAIPVHAVIRRKETRELMIGVFEDVQFGPVMLFGPGGTAGEMIQDRALAFPPLNMHLAGEMMNRTRVSRIFEGCSALPAPNFSAVALTLVKVSQLVCDIPQIVEIEINPLLADSQTVSVEEARIRIARGEDPAGRRLAIRPYPKELEEAITLPGGNTVLLRPIRAEDEPAYHRLFAGLSSEDIFLRFMSSMKSLPHNLAARLTQIDYDREMAFVLVSEAGPGDSELYGGVRISADPDNERAEFAILLRRDMTGMGLGPMLMRRIIRYARSRGIREIFGEVLGENIPMLKLCRALGFSIKRMPDDPSVMLVSLDLAGPTEH